MSFEAEWAQHKAAAGSSSPEMHLAGAGGGKGKGVLAASPAAKESAAQYIEDTLMSAVKTAGNMAEGSTGTITGSSAVWGAPWHPPMAGGVSGGGEFRDWETKTGMITVQRAWEQQVKGLLERLGHYRSALRGAKRTYQGGALIWSAWSARLSRTR
ncbi:hypothetical protein [Streptomyces reniochalinae]|uniref:Uncharacterized protein n=1 Tax=Streptomyces reniochalinae TaxID=2250578 RepID=A0A367E7P2_9ACTN|nr:hypothetical protein [Streptomyces reniochalinae]RCG13260.1 hypothetical protein DQ392_33700 [Streptomyces reniochalinae]